MLEDITLGVVGGITTSVMLFVFGVLWNQRIVPWFEERIYKGARIEGDWCGEIEYDDGNREKFGFAILRQSYRVFGTMKNLEDLREYTIQGEFKNNLLTLVYSSKVDWQIDRGCFTLVLTKNGREMHGHAAYYYSNDFSTKVAPIVLQRLTMDSDSTNSDYSSNESRN